MEGADWVRRLGGYWGPEGDRRHFKAFGVRKGSSGVSNGPEGLRGSGGGFEAGGT